MWPAKDFTAQESLRGGRLYEWRLLIGTVRAWGVGRSYGSNAPTVILLRGPNEFGCALPFTFNTNLRGRQFCYPPFTDEETKAQNGYGTGLKYQSYEMVGLHDSKCSRHYITPTYHLGDRKLYNSCGSWFSFASTSGTAPVKTVLCAPLTVFFQPEGFTARGLPVLTVLAWASLEWPLGPGGGSIG